MTAEKAAAGSAQTSPRVVMVVPGYMPEIFGGAEQQARKLSRALIERGASVVLLAPRWKRETPAHGSDGDIRLRRFRVFKPPNLGGRYSLSFLLWSLQIAVWLFLHRAEYDVVHLMHGRLHAVSPVLTAAALRKPTLVKIGTGGLNFDLAAIRRKKIYGPVLSKLVARYTTAYIANSEEVLRDLEAFAVAPDRIHRLPNGVETPEVDIQARELQTGSRTFLYLGRIEPDKAIDQMIRGFAAVNGQGAARLQLVGGSGPHLAHAQSLAQSLGISDSVEFHQPVSDVSPFLRAAHFYVSTSISEGMSNSLLEAMAYGLPPVVSRVSGVGDIVADGRSGFIFEAGSETDYREKLTAAMAMGEDDWKSMAEKAMTTIRETFGMDHIVAKHLEIYRELMTSK